MVKLGLVFPNEALRSDTGAIRDYVQTAEALGYDHVVLYDHVLGVVQEGRARPLMLHYDETSYFHEPLVLFGYLAALTSTIELATGVLVLPQRQAPVVAKQAAEVAVLSQDRLRLGVGVGWNWVEYDCLDEDFSTRGARQEEQIEVLRRLWSEPVVAIDGRWHHIDRAAIMPRPARPIPLWLGGFSEPAYRRAARLADGFIASSMGAEADAARVRFLREHVAAAGRDPDAFGVEVITGQPDDPAQLAGMLETWAGSGHTHVTIQLRLGDDATPAQHLAAIGRLAEERGTVR
jgi:probable F420-dependent oxidoreductase